jgi:hypothetical protein
VRLKDDLFFFPDAPAGSKGDLKKCPEHQTGRKMPQKTRLEAVSDLDWRPVSPLWEINA